MCDVGGREADPSRARRIRRSLARLLALAGIVSMLAAIYWLRPETELLAFILDGVALREEIVRL